MTRNKWKHPDDIHNFICRNLDELVHIYPDISRNTLGVVQRYYRRKYTVAPERETPYDSPEAEHLRAARRRGVAPQLGKTASKLIQMQVPEEHIVYHQELQQALNEHGALNKASFTDWQGFYKDKDGDAQVVDMHRKRFDVHFEHEPKFEVLIRKADSNIKPAKYERKVHPEGYKTAVILPDPQIGFRRYGDGELDPTHDELAISIAQQIIADIKPELVVCVGDLLDMSEQSDKFVTEPVFQHTTAPAIFRAHDYLAQIRASVPDARIVVLEGNHERRLHTQIVKNFGWLYGFKKPGSVSDYPELSIPSLVNFDKLDVEYISGYPANRFWINDKLQVVHGNKALSGRSTAKAYADDERVSTIFGHIHRLEQHGKTNNVRDAGRNHVAISAGCLCRIDGAVSSTKGSTDLFGRPILNYENWEQGLVVVEYKDGDAIFHPYLVRIQTMMDYETRYNGKTYRPY